jgi:hypothetical protein
MDCLSGSVRIRWLLEYADSEGFAHARRDVLCDPPVDGCAFVGGMWFAGDGVGAEDQGDDAEADIFVDAGESVGFDDEASFLFDLATHAGLYGFVDFEDAAGDLPFAGVASLDDEDAAVVVGDDGSDADRVEGASWLGHPSFTG